MKLTYCAHGLLALLLALTSLGHPQTDALVSKEPFPAFDQWKSAVLGGDADKLKALYSVNPVPRILVGEHELDTVADIHFWTALRARDMKVDVLQGGSPQVQPGRYQILFRAEIRSAAGPKEQTLYITE